MIAKLTRLVRKHGVVGFVRVASNKAVQLIAAQSPSERRQRRQARAFDERYGTDTTTHVSVAGEALANAAHAVRYQPTGLDAFARSFAALPIDHCRFTFVDVGSGKGRVLLLASEFPWKRVVGVEFFAPLADIAERNATIYKSATQRCRDITTLRADATSVELPAGPLVVYLYNPFTGPVMEGFVRNLERAIARQQPDEPTYVVYVNPADRAPFDRSPSLRVMNESEDCVIYQKGER